MAIIEKTIGNLTGKWDDVEEKWVGPPKVSASNAPITISRNDIVMIFASFDKISELDAWIASSKTVESYFSTERMTVDAAGLVLVTVMINSAVSSGTVSSEVAEAILNALTSLVNQ